MQANANMPPFKWAIVYFNRFIPLALAVGGVFFILYHWATTGTVNPEKLLTYILVTGVGFLLKEVMYQSRASIYCLGQSRFYCLLIIFYVPWLINSFIFNDFKVTPFYLNVDYLLQVSPLDFFNLKLLVFSPSIAVIWYVFDIELDRKKRREMDIKALLIDEKQIQQWNEQLVRGATIFSFVVIGLYSLVLLIVSLTIWSSGALLDKKSRQLIYVGSGLLLFWLAIGFNGVMVNFAHGWWNYWHEYGFGAMLSKQFHSARAVFGYGTSLIAVPLFLGMAFAEIRLKRIDRVKIEEYAKEKEREQSTEGEIPFGVDPDTGKTINLTIWEYNYHALYLGTTGGGKTTAILNNIEQCMISKMPCIVLDGKGSPDLPLKMKYLADKYKRKFKLFSLKADSLIKLSETITENIASYHPFSTGTFTEWKNRIMSLFPEAEGRGQLHFALGEVDTLNIILAIVKKDGARLDLKRLFDYIQDIEVIKQMAQETEDELLISEAEKIKSSQLGDIAKVLKLFLISSYGHLFDTKKNDNVIKLQESIVNDEIVLFQFDSAAYKDDTKKIAKMIINDINSAFSTIIENVGYKKPCFCIFDEFASYASSNLSDTLTLQRDNGMHAIVGTQSITTVAMADAETARVAEEIIACTGTYLILQLQHDIDIERLANVIGTKKGSEVTNQIDISEGQGATGMGSAKEVREYIVHPDDIRKLRGKDGTGVLWRKTYGKNPTRIIINKVDAPVKLINVPV